METEGITITSSPIVQLGSIANTNETISIVIPLSAQLGAIGKASISYDMKPELLNAELKLQSNGELQQIDITSPVSIQSTLAEKSNFALMIQQADKTKGCPFPTCSRYGRAFSRAHDLKRHIARHETKKERYEPRQALHTCNECGENFFNDTILQRHMNTHNKPSIVEINTVSNCSSHQEYICHVCKKKFVEIIQLASHIAAHTKESMRNICAYCGIQCENEEKLNNHMNEHTPGVELQVAIDTTSSPNNGNIDDDGDDCLLEEMLLLHKNPRFTTASTATVAAAAAKKSDSSSSTGKIRCDYCSKTFKTKWTLSSHVAAHEGRFQFGCNRCGKKFVRKSHYDGHVRSHEAARPYVCDQCGKTFKELKHRREHTKRKHPSNQMAIQNLLDSISACVAEETAVEPAKFTLYMPMNFTT